MNKLLIAIGCAAFFALSTLILALGLVFQQFKIREQGNQIAALTKEADLLRKANSVPAPITAVRLRNALTAGDVKRVQQLLNQHPTLLNAPVGGLSGTPLHSAAFRGKVSLVKDLLERKADPNLQDEHGSTPLHNAISGGYSEIVLLLLEAQADLTIKNNAGQTPLQLAMAEKPELADLLRQHGAKE